MSFSNPTLVNPAQHFFEWKGGEGKLQFYNKEKKENVIMPLPFEFIPIDQLATITGYSKMAKNGYYSNEVRSTVTDKLDIKIKGQTVFNGLYKNEQGVPQVPKGAGFTASIYIVHKNSAGEYIIGNFKANGSALSAWIEFNKGKVIGNGKVIMTKGNIQKSLVGNFYAPEFTYESLTPEDFEAANRLDKELQIYLNQYLAAAQINRTDQAENEEDVVIEDVEQPVDLTAGTRQAVENYENRESTHADPPKRDWKNVGKHEETEDDQAIEDYKQTVESEFGTETEQINLDDIPF